MERAAYVKIAEILGPFTQFIDPGKKKTVDPGINAPAHNDIRR